MDVEAVAKAVLYMASLPLDANVLNLTVMATKMPFVGRGVERTLRQNKAVIPADPGESRGRAGTHRDAAQWVPARARLRSLGRDDSWIFADDRRGAHRSRSSARNWRSRFRNTSRRIAPFRVRWRSA